MPEWGAWIIAFVNSIIEILDFFYSYSAYYCISQEKYSPQMIHQLILRFCQVNIKWKLVMQIIYNCAEVNIHTSFWTIRNTKSKVSSTPRTTDKLYSLETYSGSASLVKHWAGSLDFLKQDLHVCKNIFCHCSHLKRVKENFILHKSMTKLIKISFTFSH